MFNDTEINARMKGLVLLLNQKRTLHPEERRMDEWCLQREIRKSIFTLYRVQVWVPPHCAWGYYGKLIKKPHEIICMPHKQHNNGWHQGNGTVYLLLKWWVCTSLLDQGVGLCTALSVVARFQICVRLLWRSCCNYYSSINTSDWPVGSKKLHITHHGIETTWLKLEKDGLSPHTLSSWCQHVP